MMTNPRDPWATEVRRQAYVAVQVATAQRVATERVLAYYLRKALSHGLTIDECCEAGNLSPAVVRELTDPGSVAA